jgi:hypothetical protein
VKLSKKAKQSPKTVRPSLTGFRAFQEYAKAPLPSDVAAICGVSIDGKRVAPQAQAAAALSRRTRLRDGLEALDRLAAKLQFNQFEKSEFGDEDLRRIFGIDLQGNRARQLRAIVVRAYADADRLAQQHAEFIAARQRLPSLARQYLVRFNAFRPLVTEACDALAKMNAHTHSDLRANNLTALAELEGLGETLAEIVKGTRSRLAELPRIFFVLRLMECFVAVTTEAISYHASRSRGNAPPQTTWWLFLQAAFDTIEFPKSTVGLDDLLKKIGRAPECVSSVKRLKRLATTPQGLAGYRRYDLASDGIKPNLLRLLIKT